MTGNRLSETRKDGSGNVVEAINYTYNNDDQLKKQISSVSGETDFSYDANGSQTDDGTHKYFYDLRNKLIKITDESGNILATYVYDDAGNRVQETTSGTTSYYLTDTNNPTGYAQPIEQWDSTSGSRSNATLKMIYVIGDRILAQADNSGNVSYLLVDGHGSTRLLTSSTGVVTQTLNYDVLHSPRGELALFPSGVMLKRIELCPRIAAVLDQGEFYQQTPRPARARLFRVGQKNINLLNTTTK